MRRNVFFLLGLLAITFACFWPVGHLGFIGYDDYDYVYQNPAVQSGLDWDSFVWAFKAAHAGNWHPVTWMSHMLDCDLFGLDPHEEHWVNLGLHAANTVLLFLWLFELTAARWRSFLVAALFAVHPLHVQSVAWISERKDVLSGFFFLATLLVYTRYCRQKSAFGYVLVVLTLALGLMSKPMLVTTPLVLLLLDFWPLGRVPTSATPSSTLAAQINSWRPLFIEKIPLFLLCAISCVVTLWAQSSGRAINSMQQFPLGIRLLHAVIAYSLYLWKMIAPVNLAILYPLPFARPSALAVFGALALLIMTFGAAIWRRKAQPYLLVGWTWFFVMLLPVIGIVQVGLQSIADRYAYLPSIGLFMAVVWGMADIARRSSLARAAMAGLGGALVLACGLDSRHQLGFWRDNITLFQHVVDISPKNNFMGYFYLGISYGELGQLDSAARALKASLEAEPDFKLARSRLGNVLLVQKKYAEAEPLLAAQARANPDSFAAHMTLGMALVGEHKYAAAQAEYLTAQRLTPDNPDIPRYLAAIQRQADAEATITKFAGQPPDKITADMHSQLAVARSILGHYAEAAKEYKLALAQKPDSVEWLNNLAWLLATCPDPSVRNGPEAISLAQRACELTQFKKTIFLGTLAAACAEAGQFDTAVTNAKKACDNAAALGETDLLQANQQLLALYQNHKPYHGPAPMQ